MILFLYNVLRNTAFYLMMLIISPFVAGLTIELGVYLNHAMSCKIGESFGDVRDALDATACKLRQVMGVRGKRLSKT